MIIGNGSNMQGNKGNFVNNNIPGNNNMTENQSPSQFNPMIEANRTMQHTDVTSKDEMTNKAFAILEDRLNKGLISMDEFKKKCAQIGKRQ